jgi:hypothetical protein
MESRIIPNFCSPCILTYRKTDLNASISGIKKALLPVKAIGHIGACVNLIQLEDHILLLI